MLTETESKRVGLLIATVAHYRANPLDYISTDTSALQFPGGYGQGARLNLKPLSTVIYEKDDEIQFLGAGCYGSVFSISDTKVFKVLHREDDAYVTYASYCAEADHNPLLPIVYEMGKIGDSNYYYFVLERLEGFEEWNTDHELQYKVLRHYFNNNSAFGIFNLMSEETKKALDNIKKLNNNAFHKDLHTGNVMFRRITTEDQSDFYYQAVITDPFS